MLEILIATALVGFGILTMIGVYASGIQMMGQNRDMAVALDLARSVIVGSRELGLPGVPPGPVVFNGQPAVKDFPPWPYYACDVNGQAYKVVVAVSPVNPRLRQLTVGVYWGTSHNVVLESRLGP